MNARIHRLLAVALVLIPASAFAQDCRDEDYRASHAEECKDAKPPVNPFTWSGGSIGAYAKSGGSVMPGARSDAGIAVGGRAVTNEIIGSLEATAGAQSGSLAAGGELMLRPGARRGGALELSTLASIGMNEDGSAQVDNHARLGGGVALTSPKSRTRLYGGILFESNTVNPKDFNWTRSHVDWHRGATLPYVRGAVDLNSGLALDAACTLLGRDHGTRVTTAGDRRESVRLPSAAQAPVCQASASQAVRVLGHGVTLTGDARFGSKTYVKTLPADASQAPVLATSNVPSLRLKVTVGGGR